MFSEMLITSNMLSYCFLISRRCYYFFVPVFDVGYLNLYCVYTHIIIRVDCSVILVIAHLVSVLILCLLHLYRHSVGF